MATRKAEKKMKTIHMNDQAEKFLNELVEWSEGFCSVVDAMSLDAALDPARLTLAEQDHLETLEAMASVVQEFVNEYDQGNLWRIRRKAGVVVEWWTGSDWSTSQEEAKTYEHRGPAMSVITRNKNKAEKEQKEYEQRCWSNAHPYR